jgi:hypothetical protein
MHQEPSEPPELPAPTIWPAVLAGGITLLAMGLVTSLVFSLAGALVMALGLGGWIRELLHG